MVTEEGRAAAGTFQVVDGLTKPLAAVSDSCDRGNMSVFDNQGSYLLPPGSPEADEIRALLQKAKQKTQLHRKSGVYGMYVWVQGADAKGDNKAPCHWRGKA